MKTIIHSILITILFLFIGCNKNKNIRQEFYSSGQLKYEVQVTNDLRNGNEIEYYESGFIKMQGTCINDNEAGFYYYYNMNQQLDSIIEYVPVNIEKPLDTFFEDNDHDKNGSVVNRQIIFKEREVDRKKSVHFEISLKKDTILLGDTIRGLVDFVNQSNNQKNKFKVYIRTEKNETNALSLEPKDNEQLSFFNFIPKTKGKHTLKGLIEEQFEATDNVRFLFFEKEYYVK